MPDQLVDAYYNAAKELAFEVGIKNWTDIELIKEATKKIKELKSAVAVFSHRIDQILKYE